jgi:hypothetical protein
MYQFGEDFNLEARFPFQRKWIENRNWSMLPSASKAILPVISSYANAIGEAWPSEQTIGIVAGLSAKQVRTGINGLEGFPGFSLGTLHHAERAAVQKVHAQQSGAEKKRWRIPLFSISL